MDNRQHGPHRPSSEQSTSGEYRYLMDLLRACGGQSLAPRLVPPPEAPEGVLSQTTPKPIKSHRA